MKYQLIFAAALAALFAGTAVAQHAHSAYAGRESRDIKALSAEEMRQYQSGAGMGYAQAAELNRFPGPMHVLELEKPLALTPEQRAATQQLMDAHKTETRAIGAKLIEAERELDCLFAGGRVDAQVLSAQVRKVAALQGEYRLSHLETHRRMRALLDQEQVARYAQLRGYDSIGATQTHSGAHGH